MPDKALARSIAFGMELGGLDVVTLAARIDESPLDLSKWIIRPRSMPVDTAASVAAALGVSLSAMLDSPLESVVHSRG